MTHLRWLCWRSRFHTAPNPAAATAGITHNHLCDDVSDPANPCACGCALQVMAALGMMPALPLRPTPPPPNYLTVTLDGMLLGHMQSGLVDGAVARLRVLKSTALAMAEVGVLPEGVPPLQVCVM